MSGIVSGLRVDTRMAQLHYFRAQAAAAADGAINLALAEQEACGPVAREVQIVCKITKLVPICRNSDDTRRVVRQHQHGESARTAGPFCSGGPAASLRGVEWDESPMALARAVIEFRDGAGRRREQSFHSPEDLLRVPGVSRGVYIRSVTSLWKIWPVVTLGKQLWVPG